MAAMDRSNLDSPTAKIMAVLGSVARLGSAQVSQIAEDTGLAVPTAYRICVELERIGHLQRMAGTRAWTAARPLVELAASTLASAAASAASEAALAALTRETGEMASFAVQAGQHVLYVASAEAPHELTLSFRAGRRTPLFCTSSGRLFLARMSEESLAAYLASADLPAYTRHTVTDRRRLRRVIDKVRAQGYAVTNQEYILHVLGAAVPVETGEGMHLGALSIAAPDVRMSLGRLRELLPVLEKASRGLARCLAPQAGSRAAGGGAEHRARA